MWTRASAGTVSSGTGQCFVLRKSLKLFLAIQASAVMCGVHATICLVVVWLVYSIVQAYRRTDSAGPRARKMSSRTVTSSLERMQRHSSFPDASTALAKYGAFQHCIVMSISGQYISRGERMTKTSTLMYPHRHQRR